MGFMSKIKNYFAMEDEYEYMDEEIQYSEPVPDKRKSNVVSLASYEQASSKVVLCEPRTYSEAQNIADNIVNKRAVVINLQRLDHQEAKRVVDFLSGTIYAVNGNIQKLGAQTFLCTPDNIDVSGSISEMASDEIDKGW